MSDILGPELAEPYLVRVETNNRLHLRFRIQDRSVDDSRCGIDENWVEEDWLILDNVDPDRLCRYCFPPSVSAMAGAAEASGVMQ